MVQRLLVISETEYQRLIRGLNDIHTKAIEYRELPFPEPEQICLDRIAEMSTDLVTDLQTIKPL